MTFKKPRLRQSEFNRPIRPGKIRYGVAAWLVGLPLPIIILAVLFRGCDW